MGREIQYILDPATSGIFVFEELSRLRETILENVAIDK